jgi:TolB-like protein/class 3 adenylate cyclase
MDRKLAAILAADVVGYSALMERDEAGTHERLKAGRKELFEPEIARHHGRVFKVMGDGMLAEFGSVVDAVECAVALQRGLAERNMEFPEAERIQVRIGINLGEVIVEGEDRYGEGVNIATRLEQLAEPGGIYVSGKVAKEVEKKLAFGFEAMGEQKVKNIAEPVPVYRIKLGEPAGPTPATAARRVPRAGLMAAGLAVIAVIVAAGIYGFLNWRATEAPSLPDKPSIAVLPFDNLSDDPQQAYFADGMAEDLLTDLSRISGLFVIARNSSFAYRGKAVDVRQVARELGVRYVLEGSVRRAGEQVRINVQLVDGQTGSHQWAERYDGQETDIFALQDKVTKAVVEALALQLTSGEQQALKQQDTAVPGAYDAFLRGWEYYRKGAPEDLVLAIPHFERAVQLDPAYGRAEAALAMIYFRIYDQNWSGRLGMNASETFRKAREHLARAQVHPTAISHQVAGNISRDRGWYEDAFKEFNAALALEPGESWNYAYRAYAFIWWDRPADALAEIDKALRADPQPPPLFIYYRGLALLGLKRLADALEEFEKAAKLSPDDPWPRLFLAATYALNERIEDSRNVVAAFNEARVKQGGLPLVMDEIRRYSLKLKVPLEGNLYGGLAKAGVPHNFDSGPFDKLKLTGPEIDALVFGHRLHGRTLETGGEHGLSVAADGSYQSFGNWGVTSGTAKIEGGRFCLVSTTTHHCVDIYRNPGGTKARENEFNWFDGWGRPFSQVQ